MSEGKKEETISKDHTWQEGMERPEEAMKGLDRVLMQEGIERDDYEPGMGHDY